MAQFGWYPGSRGFPVGKELYSLKEDLHTCIDGIFL